MLFYHFNYLLQIFISILMVVQSIGEFLERLEKTVQVHLVVVLPPHHVLVNYVVVRFQNVSVSQPWVFRQFLEL